MSYEVCGVIGVARGVPGPQCPTGGSFGEQKVFERGKIPSLVSDLRREDGEEG